MNSDDFISRARNTVLENLLNPQFGVVMLAKEMGISRSELYKRIKAIKNKSASQFIREIRLERALELIKTESYSFGEIAYMVGFSSPTYFSTSFKDYFGYSPSVSKQNGNVPKSEKIPKTKNRTIPLVLGAIAILIL
ncbi:MAG: helix-turn-helix transcriptional regulator, partial [Eudoraea sp.]|nr:helix-turn-helix transcriptional regulator [Eudoraea sp.]